MSQNQELPLLGEIFIFLQSTGIATQLQPSNWAEFWGSIRNNSLTHVMDEPIAGDAQVDLLFTNNERLTGEMIVNSSFSNSDQETEEFTIPWGGKKASSRLQILGSRRPELSLFKQLVGVTQRRAKELLKAGRSLKAISWRMILPNNQEKKQISRSVQQGTHDCVSKQTDSMWEEEAGTSYKGAL